MANAINSKRILEVACGPGRHSLFLASNFLTKDKGVLVSCDFSNGMVKKLKRNYNEGDHDYNKVPGNKSVIDDQTDYLALSDEDNTKLKNMCDVQKIIDEQGDFRKLVIGCQANNELLPFPSDFFDCYISNLSIHIVCNPLNQAKEAFRVMKHGSAACFTVWGRRERSLQFTFWNKVLAEFLNEDQMKTLDAERTHFYMWDDEGAHLKDCLEKAGFKGIKYWVQAQNFMIRTGH